jgi:hypothetical protein
MRTLLNPIPLLVALAIMLPLAGCGDGNNDNIFIGETPTPNGARTPTPARTSTPATGATATPVDGATENPAETPSAGGPTATATPSGPACQAGDQIVVTESLDKTFGAARTDLLYPASVSIPGTGTASSVSQRVVFTPTGGLTQVNDTASSGSVDDTLTTSFVGTTDVAAGTFVTVTFDCVEGQSPPTAGAFTCTVVSASTGGGTQIPDEQCTLTVTGP